MLFDKEGDKRGGHHDDADEGEDARGTKDAEKKEETADEDEQHPDASGEF